MTIFRSMGLKCVAYLKYFMPVLKDVMDICSAPGLREMLIQQFCILVATIQHFTKDYLDLIMQIMEQYWDYESLQDKIVGLLEEISRVLIDEFTPCLHKFLPKMLSVLKNKGTHSGPIMHALRVFGTAVDPYLYTIVPAIVGLFDSANSYQAILCIGHMTYIHDLSPYLLLIYQPLLVAIKSPVPEIQNTALRTCTDLFSTVEESSPFVDPLLAFLEKSAIVCPHLEETLSRLKNKQAIPREVPMEYSTHRGLDSEDLLPFETNHPRSFKSNHEILGTAWDTTWCSTKADWTEWFRKLSITMLKESPSPALRCCSGLATNYQPVALELFNPGFVSCWDSLTEEFQKTTVEYIDKAISSPTIPNEELHYLLDLAEFMERSEKTQKYTLEINKLAHLAEKICAYAKALYYREKEFKQNPSQKIVGQIISLNDALGQHEAAQGMFRYNKEKFKTKLDITLYEKLQRWIKVLKRYEELQKQKPNDLSIILGRMRCLQNLGQWEDVVALAEKALSFPSSSSNGELALFAKRASLNLGRWDDLEKYINIDKKEIDGGFYHAVLLVHRNDFGNAKKVIDMCRETAVNDLMALVGESYRRAYDVVVRIQQLTELEEVITYKTSSQERKEMIKTLWENRLAGVERNVEVWQNILSVRSLVLPPQSNPEIWVKFSNLSRKNMRFKRAEIILTQLLLGDSKLTQTASIDPKVKYVYINLLWQKDQKEEAFSNMKEWVADFPRLNVPPSRQARCYVKLAQWQLYLNDSSLNETVIPSMIQSCKLAIELDGDWHKAWHTWAIINYRVLGHYLKESESNIDPYLLHALTGFIRAISLAPTENIQDTLRLLTLWFSYGHKRIVEISIREGFDIINPDTWLSVIPQIIARIHNPLRTVKNGIQQLLINLGKRHPQALVFPITVAQRSPFKQRVTASKSIINAIRQFNPKLIQETEIVSEELIRIAILWKEKWFKGLEEASHFYYVERQESKMMAVLQPLHEMLRNGPVTQHEKAVAKAFGRDLEKAWDCCKEYSKTRKESSMNLAWDLYAHVYRIIKRHLQTEFDKLHLSNISPELMKIKDLDLAVPGTYMKTFKAGKSVISITSFAQVLKVIPSKQKPRKTIIHGSDGNEYPFLLKGNEDLRQDERVMQLFSLVNNLLESDDITSKNHLSIQRYSVIPLCSDSGLIEWLPHSDTLHELLTVYRKAHSIPIDAELTLMQRFCMKNEYFKLPLIKKLEVFEFALDNTHGEGDDLERILWLNSPNAESWLDKRTTYTRSLAVMSMVGYILGLGDRHPNNLMLNRNSGKVIHIDFGDCFEVAMLRERFAELVPFRLTRMLINALEVSGIRGTFRATCETVMRVLRDNKESMLAVLEAFVYDPLINWRLTKNPGAPSNYNGDDDEVDALLVDKQKGYSGVSTGMTGSGTTTVSNASGLTLPQYSESSEDFLYSDENSLDEEGYDHGKFEHRALKIIERVSYKLSGRDFPGQTLSVEKQVDLLIKQATSHELLCQAYLGWCPYW
uniref:non-specific serine/threonine protein kinase n=1 Tax=Arcella intermedia TaxID=1963864 RepID=A0A6B2KWQ4_9EUKA